MAGGVGDAIAGQPAVLVDDEGNRHGAFLPSGERAAGITLMSFQDRADRGPVAGLECGGYAAVADITLAELRPFGEYGLGCFTARYAGRAGLFFYRRLFDNLLFYHDDGGVDGRGFRLYFDDFNGLHPGRFHRLDHLHLLQFFRRFQRFLDRPGGFGGKRRRRHDGHLKALQPGQCLPRLNPVDRDQGQGMQAQRQQHGVKSLLQGKCHLSRPDW